jgi:phage shock protein A
MKFWQRMGRTLRADAHGVIDAIEDRALLLKQHLREAELEVQRKQARCAALTAEEEQRKRQKLRLEAECLDHERDAELAVESGEDALARFALSAWLSKREAQQRISERLDLIDKERVELTKLLAQQEPELEALRTRVSAFVRESEERARGQYQGHGHAQGESGSLEPRAVASERIEIELLRRKRAHTSDAAGGTS